jgi:hypothetical protein
MGIAALNPSYRPDSDPPRPSSAGARGFFGRGGAVAAEAAILSETPPALC